MKRIAGIAAALIAAAALFCGCGRAAPRPSASPAASAQAESAPMSYPPDKTASQDTAGADTKLPEAATAANTIEGTLAP